MSGWGAGDASPFHVTEMHESLTSSRTLGVPLYRLMLEEHKDVFPVSLDAVQKPSRSWLLP
jgi:hypothetical protein